MARALAVTGFVRVGLAGLVTAIIMSLLCTIRKFRCFLRLSPMRSRNDEIIIIKKSE